MRLPRTLLLTTTLLALAACSPDDRADTEAEVAADTATNAPADPGTDPVAQTYGTQAGTDADQSAVARATLEPTEGNEVTGELGFEAEGGLVHISGEVRGLSADSVHGFHVHETGDCSAPDASSAGGHFNPGDNPHGRAGEGEHHAGDSDNIRADAQGVAMVDATLHGATLGDGGPADIAGKAVIVHAGADDYTTQPTGDAGARLACGVINL
ncbi:superoxide dismutase family protein [Luteimonas sp. RD2P54]|uniref:Superoxide dismutase [Cu-Zn] n=1 Tax=Luteimonas endophytica TaxID=3042023 RepID=A0ABT6J903_9GAMM|nr:superoxide dismutase family protein [Luteimonas endophytica]MDH5823302.1 superoxide dismutase family protein [Luteimonas endophytica]